MSADRAEEDGRGPNGSSRQLLAAIDRQTELSDDTDETPAREIARCVRTDYTRIVRVVTMVTGSVELAEDAVQEAFARAWEKAERGQTFTHPPGWVLTVALNEARTRRRRSTTEKRAIDRLRARPVAHERPSHESDDDAGQIRMALDGLTRRQRDVITLHYLMDLDVTTTASLLHVSESTVKSALDRARRKLAVSLRAEMRNSDD